MILKDKAPSTSLSIKIKAGDKQELDVAFYLREHSKITLQLFVFNDVKFRTITNQHSYSALNCLYIWVYFNRIKKHNNEVAINEHQEWSVVLSRKKWQGTTITNKAS